MRSPIRAIVLPDGDKDPVGANRPRVTDRARSDLEREPLGASAFSHSLGPVVRTPWDAGIVPPAFSRGGITTTLLKSRRQQIHGRIASTLEEKFPHIVTIQPELLRSTAPTEGGLVKKAVWFWVRAGQQSVARCAMSEAVAQIRKGLDLLSGLLTCSGACLAWLRRAETLRRQ
jgi:hypothetical protein